MEKIVALIPLRGGSKSIPQKNIRMIASKPLCAWVLEAAHNVLKIDEVYVSTDSYEIAAVVEKLGLGTKIIMRPEHLATDSSTTESVMLHFTEQVDYDILVTIQATSPLLRDVDLSNALELFSSEKYDSLLSAVRVKRFYWQDNGVAINYDPTNRPRRQDFSGTLMENGAFYISKRDIVLENECRLGGRIGIYEMPEQTAVEIDEPDDWDVVEKLLQSRTIALFNPIIERLKMLIVDVDGTLTDGGMYYSPEGDFLKKFNTRDAMGLALLKKIGIQIAIITSENTPIVTARAKKLGILECHTGIENKIKTVKGICQKYNLQLSEIAYMGDDLNDYECMKIVGFAACPSNAVPEIQGVAHYIAKYAGGEGAVRDVSDYIRNVIMYGLQTVQ